MQYQCQPVWVLAPRQAKELNRVNGMPISRQLNNTHTLLNTMRTAAGAAEAGVYGPTGQTAVSQPSRRFVTG